jgi:ribonuclease inhibitor
MKHITIDCTLIPDKAALHQALAQALNFPDYYGNNLDALYDCLTDIREDITLTLQSFHTMGIFRGSFQAVLEEAEQENPHLIVTIA